MKRDEILTGLRALIADSLARKADDVKPESRLIDDLGADSLVFVDIVFSMEKKFGVKLRDGELDFLSRLDFSSPQVMKGGYLTAETIDRLTVWLPALERVADRAKVTPRQLFGFITLETLAVLVERKLAAGR